MVGTVVVADTLPVADNLPHQVEVEDTLPAAVAAGIVPAAPDGLDHVYFHPAVPHTTLPHAFSQSDAPPPASLGYLGPFRPAVLLDTRRASAVHTAGATAVGRTHLELEVGLRTGVGPGHRAVGAVVVGIAAAESCSLCFAEVHHMGLDVAGRRRMCYHCHICCHLHHIWNRVPGRRMTASMTSHRGYTREAVPALGSCLADRCQSIRNSVPAVHATTIVSIHPLESD